MTDTRALVGTSGWNKPQWRGHFYPPGLPQKREFAFTAERLASLELNTTFYGLRAPTEFTRWHDDTPQHLVFSVKAHKAVTHELRLRNVSGALADFFASGVLGLREKMGPMLWQVPPSLPFEPAVVEAFFAALPRTVGAATRLVTAQGRAVPAVDTLGDEHPLRHCFEARHESFLSPAFTVLLRRHSIAPVIVNAPGRPVIRDVTSDFVYLRLHSDAEHFPTATTTRNSTAGRTESTAGAPAATAPTVADATFSRTSTTPTTRARAHRSTRSSCNAERMRWPASRPPARRRASRARCGMNSAELAAALRTHRLFPRNSRHTTQERTTP